jgi:membrane associated rhomboid family serine protease
MDKTKLVLLILFIIATIAFALFLAITLNHTIKYYDQNSLLLSILWFVATAGCVFGVVWIVKKKQ